MDRKFSWRVEGTTPDTASGRAYNRNVNLQVIAVTMERVIVAVRDLYPDFRFIKILLDRHLEEVILDK